MFVFLSVEGIIPECSAKTQTMMDRLERGLREDEIGFPEKRGFKNNIQKRKRMNKDLKRPEAHVQRAPRTYLFTTFMGFRDPHSPKVNKTVQ